MSTLRLSDTSYAVLGLVDLVGDATPYQLKQIAQVSILHFWTIPHTQLYTECARLAEGGLLAEHREQAGRRRRVYQLTAGGRRALDEWRGNPEAGLYELRDPGLLKLFLGGDPRALAELQLDRHRQRLSGYEQLSEMPAMTEGARLALEAGIGHEREYIRFWTEVLERPSRRRT